MDMAAPSARAPATTKASAIPRAELAPGLEISRLLQGCWQLSGGHAGDRATDRTSGQAAIDDFSAFVAAGITTFDTADIYGPSESLIGLYLNPPHKEGEPEPVLTKFCCFGDSMNQAKELRFVEQSIDASRQRLGVESLDLVQFYWHNYGNKNYVAAAQHLAALQKKGKVKHVGATNFDVPRLQEFVDAGVTIANNQVQYSLLDRRPENGMADFCAQHNIKLLPYGVLAGGFLSDKYLGVSPKQVKIDTYSKSKYSSVIGQAGGWDWYQSLLRELSEVAKRHGVTIADVACRWVLDKPQVAGIIVGARNASHVADHEKIFSFELDAADQERISKVLAEGKQSTSDCYSWERGGKW
ncbi:hypothetical protein ABPG77_010169 [Micractinium sp. CCAP 211/92]